MCFIKCCNRYNNPNNFSFSVETDYKAPNAFNDGITNNIAYNLRINHNTIMKNGSINRSVKLLVCSLLSLSSVITSILSIAEVIIRSSLLIASTPLLCCKRSSCIDTIIKNLTVSTAESLGQILGGLYDAVSFLTTSRAIAIHENGITRLDKWLETAN